MPRATRKINGKIYRGRTGEGTPAAAARVRPGARLTCSPPRSGRWSSSSRAPRARARERAGGGVMMLAGRTRLVTGARPLSARCARPRVCAAVVHAAPSALRHDCARRVGLVFVARSAASTRSAAGATARGQRMCDPGLACSWWECHSHAPHTSSCDGPRKTLSPPPRPASARVP